MDKNGTKEPVHSRYAYRYAKACPKSCDIATNSLVWEIQIGVFMCNERSLCTRYYSDLTRKWLIGTRPNNRQYGRHTKYSFDAYVFGVTASPDDAYRYAKGEGIEHPLGYEMKLKEPLDFYSVTDHGFYMGMIQAYADTSTDISQNDFAEPFHNLNRLDNLTVESAGERSNIFSSVLGATIIRPYPNWHPKLLKAYFTRNKASC